MSTPTMDEAAKVLADPTAYADDTRLHTALTHLRANNPVAWVDNPPYRPFWAITKHADIMAIERANDLFLSEPRPLLATAEADDAFKAQIEAGIGIRTLVHMDDPHHRKVRAIGADWFRPKAMRDLKTRVDELAKRYVDRMRDIGPECDFVTDVATEFPALRDPFPARPAGGRLPADAQADPGDVRRRRRRTSARRFDGGPARRAGRLLHLLHRADRVAGASTRPRTWRRRSPTAASTANRCQTWTPCRTT